MQGGVAGLRDAIEREGDKQADPVVVRDRIPSKLGKDPSEAALRAGGSEIRPALVQAVAIPGGESAEEATSEAGSDDEVPEIPDEAPPYNP